jgi:hypothetical protein
VGDHKVRHPPSNNLPFHPLVFSLGGRVNGSTTKVFASWKQELWVEHHRLYRHAMQPLISKSRQRFKHELRFLGLQRIAVPVGPQTESDATRIASGERPLDRGKTWTGERRDWYGPSNIRGGSRSPRSLHHLYPTQERHQELRMSRQWPLKQRHRHRNPLPRLTGFRPAHYPWHPPSMTVWPKDLPTR